MNADTAYGKLGFDRIDVTGCSSVDDIFKSQSKSRIGIYMLGLSDNTYYIGKSKIVTTRFRTHLRDHLRKFSLNIESFGFLPFRNEELSHNEKSMIHKAESFGVPIRNNTYVADVIAHNEIYDLIPENIQRQWLANPTVIINAKKYIIVKAQRLKTDHKFFQLSNFPEYPSIKPVLDEFIRNCIIAPAATQKIFWSLTAAPGTCQNSRLCCLNVNWMEVLVCGRLHFWDFVNVSYSELKRQFGSLAVFNKTYPIEYTKNHYVAAGGDDVRLYVENNFDLFCKLIRDPKVQAAARLLTLRLMRKGQTAYSKYHCPAFVDDILSQKK